MQENVIEVKSLTKKYGDYVAVNDISFSIRRGEIFALLGPNGAGKTTTVEILECIKTLTSGTVAILGYDIAGDEVKIKHKIGVLPQSFNAYDALTVYENIDYFASMYPRHVDIGHLIEELGLKDKRNVRFKKLSGGLKQRVGIAIALINDPEVIFLDEPTSGLDPKIRHNVWDAIRELKHRGKTVLLTTHYMDEAYYLADKVCILHKGKIIAEGAPEDLINSYGGGNTLIIRGCSEAIRDDLAQAIDGSRVDGNDVLAKLPDRDYVATISKAVSLINAGGLSCKELYIKKIDPRRRVPEPDGRKARRRGAVNVRLYQRYNVHDALRVQEPGGGLRHHHLPCHPPPDIRLHLRRPVQPFDALLYG
jgi:ABC-2 type transport system ATP-binding protein